MIDWLVNTLLISGLAAIGYAVWLWWGLPAALVYGGIMAVMLAALLHELRNERTARKPEKPNA